MLRNNNRAVIKRMAKTSLKSNRQKNLVMLAAVVLSAFMLFSVLTAGITYFQMWRLQNLRLQGGEYDAIMYGCSDEQMKMLQENKDVTEIGIVSIAGSIVETEKTDLSEIMLLWEDDTSWNVMGRNARTSLKGNYPVKENEVMVTQKALKEGGLLGYGIGDSFRATWLDGNGKKRTMEFVISGIWDGYGSKNLFYVSESFFEKSGYELSNPNCGRIQLGIRQKIMTQQQKNDFTESMKLKKMQAIVFTTELANALPIYLGLFGLLVVICLCAWLLIYNIMYLSVTGNIRYYGLLATIGMTGKQIYGLIYRQLFYLGAAGIMTGTVSAMGISFFVMPSVVRAFGISEKVEVVFHPSVFLLTVTLLALTILFAGRKPAKLAAAVSPVEASRYAGSMQSAKHPLHIGEKGSVIWRMGARKVVKDRKKTAVITLSLSIGLSVFLCMITLIKSQGPRTIVSSAWGDDLEIMNKTLRTDETEKWKELWNGELEQELKNIPGVKDVHLVSTAGIMIPWEPEFSDLWMHKIYDRWILDPYEPFMQQYKKHPEDFGTCLVGIDKKSLPVLNETLEKPLDEKAFLEGRTCVVYQNGLDLGIKELAGKKVRCADAENTSHTFAFEIAGCTPSYEFLGPDIGMLPTVIISDRALAKLGIKTYHYKVLVYYDEAYDEETEHAVKSFMEQKAGAKNLKYESKIEDMKEIEAAQGNMMYVGTGISLILALIGIMNYFNTMIGNIESRKKELEILENIGMTYRQMKQMLIREGALYAGISVLLTLMIGLPVTYVLFSSMNYMKVPFFIPVVPVALFVLAVIAICMFIPVVIQKMFRAGKKERA